LADDRPCEGIGPAGALAFAGDGELGAGGSEQTEGEAAEDGEVLGAVVGAGPGAVLVDGDVEHPVERVLDRGEGLGGEAARTQMVAGGGRPVVAAGLDAGEPGEAGHGGRAGLRSGAEEPIDRMAYPVAGGLDPAVAGIRRREDGKRLGRVGEDGGDPGQHRRAVPLQRQETVPAAVQHQLRGLSPGHGRHRR